MSSARAAMSRPFGRLLFVRRLREREIGLQQLELRRGARLESIARGFASAGGEAPQIARDAGALDGGDELEVRDAHQAADVQCSHRDVGRGFRERRIRQIDAAPALAAALERQAEAEDFVRRVPRRFERRLRIRPFSGHADARLIDGAAQPGRDERAVVRIGGGQRRLQRESRRGRVLRALVADECRRGQNPRSQQCTHTVMVRASARSERS